MNDEVLKELINEDVLHFDESALAEKLLFIDNFAIEYDDNFTVLYGHPTKEQDRMKRQITANMNISLGDNDNIYQYDVLLFYVGYIL